MRTRLNMFMLGRNGVDFLNKHLFRIFVHFDKGLRSQFLWQQTEEHR